MPTLHREKRTKPHRGCSPPCTDCSQGNRRSTRPGRARPETASPHQHRPVPWQARQGHLWSCVPLAGPPSGHARTVHAPPGRERIARAPQAAPHHEIPAVGCLRMALRVRHTSPQAFPHAYPSLPSALSTFCPLTVIPALVAGQGPERRIIKIIRRQQGFRAGGIIPTSFAGSPLISKPQRNHAGTAVVCYPD